MNNYFPLDLFCSATCDTNLETINSSNCAGRNSR